MSFFSILLLALVQGAAELLPVSSSAHVIVAEKFLGLDPSSPEMTFLLVMLHTGTMFAVLVYFGRRWMQRLRGPSQQAKNFVVDLTVATFITGVVGIVLKTAIEHLFLNSKSNSDIEALFGNLPLIAFSLACAGVLIVVTGNQKTPEPGEPLTRKKSVVIGAVQGLCLPFRGFSRSGATISTAMGLKVSKLLAEDFSFALAVILTPVVVAREMLRLLHAHHDANASFHMMPLVWPGLIGMALSFASGLAALKLLSRVLEAGNWKYFGYYCFFASALVLIFHFTIFS